MNESNARLVGTVEPMAKPKRGKAAQVLKLINQSLPVIHHEGEPESLRDKIMALFEKKKKGEPEPCYKEFVDAWCLAYPKLGMKAGARAGRSINEIIAQTRQELIDRNWDTSNEMMVKVFKYVLWWVQSHRKFPHNEPITSWPNHYLSVWLKIEEELKPNTQIKANSSQVFGKYANQ